MKRYLFNALFISTCAISVPALAFDLNDVSNTLNSAANTAKAVQETQDRFTDTERNTYKEHYNKELKNKNHDNDVDYDNKGHDKKYSSLPPGLQKKVANGGSLPPGWQKKVAAGQVFDADLRNYSYRSPYASPKGTSTYILENKVIRVLDATNVILDVLTN